MFKSFKDISVESHNEAGEESAKVGWTCRKNGRVRLMKRMDALGVEDRKRRGRPRPRWEDCVKRDLVGMGGERRMRASDRGGWRLLVETSKTRLAMKKNGKQKSTTGICASLTPDYREKEESKNISYLSTNYNDKYS